MFCLQEGIETFIIFVIFAFILSFYVENSLRKKCSYNNPMQKALLKKKQTSKFHHHHHYSRLPPHPQPPRHHLQGHPLQFFRRRNPWTYPLTSHSNLRVWQGNYQKITWERRKRRTWKIYSQWIHWGTEKVLGENKNV